VNLVAQSGFDRMNKIYRIGNETISPAMNNMKQLAQDKAEEFTSAVTSDSRWRLEDELMCQVFGFTLYGYVFGVGRVICFMDVQLDKGQALTIETFLTWQAR
jgi:hypothetical protein